MRSGPSPRTRLVDWFFRDRRSGRIVVAQAPNIPLVIWLVASAVRVVLRLHGGWGAMLSVVATLALGWWAVDEIARGVNPWRRVLGGVVLTVLVATRAWQLI